MFHLTDLWFVFAKNITNPKSVVDDLPKLLSNQECRKIKHINKNQSLSAKHLFSRNLLRFRQYHGRKITNLTGNHGEELFLCYCGTLAKTLRANCEALLCFTVSMIVGNKSVVKIALKSFQDIKKLTEKN